MFAQGKSSMTMCDTRYAQQETDGRQGAAAAATMTAAAAATMTPNSVTIITISIVIINNNTSDNNPYPFRLKSQLFIKSLMLISSLVHSCSFAPDVRLLRVG